jgi:hypothetical protein
MAAAGSRSWERAVLRSAEDLTPIVQSALDETGSSSGLEFSRPRAGFHRFFGDSSPILHGSSRRMLASSMLGEGCLNEAMSQTRKTSVSSDTPSPRIDRKSGPRYPCSPH